MATTASWPCAIEASPAPKWTMTVGDDTRMDCRGMYRPRDSSIIAPLPSLRAGDLAQLSLWPSCPLMDEPGVWGSLVGVY